MFEKLIIYIILLKVLTTNDVEICSILNGTSNNYGIVTLINAVRDSLPPSLLHPCPYNERVEMNNVTIDTAKIPSIFPSGNYRTRMHFYNDKDSNIISATVFASCTSSIKTSF